MIKSRFQLTIIDVRFALGAIRMIKHCAREETGAVRQIVPPRQMLFGNENVAEKSNYNIFEIKWFDEFLSAYKIDNIINPSDAEIEAYRGKLPDFLLRFWTDHGWCSWSDGQYWLCNPSLPKPVLGYVFRGDPELNPEKMYAFGGCRQSRI
ncbi:GAD-like domain-containing protein [Rhizobium leguminosarum]